MTRAIQCTDQSFSACRIIPRQHVPSRWWSHGTCRGIGGRDPHGFSEEGTHANCKGGAPESSRLHTGRNVVRHHYSRRWAVGPRIRLRARHGDHGYSHYHQIAKVKPRKLLRASSLLEIPGLSPGHKSAMLRRRRVFGWSAAVALCRHGRSGEHRRRQRPGERDACGSGRIIKHRDDVVFPLDAFTREIDISDIAPNLRQIRVIVRYQIGHLARQYELVAFISSLPNAGTLRVFREQIMMRSCTMREQGLAWRNF